MEKNNQKQKEALYSVILGYNIATLNDEKVFIRHFGARDKIEVDYQYSLAYESAISKDVITKAEKEKQIIEGGLWSEEKNMEIASLNLSVENLKKRKTHSLPSQIKEINKQIDEQSSKARNLSRDKDRLIGLTAEGIATRRAEDFYIATSFFEDSAFKNRLIQFEEFDDMDTGLIDSMKLSYFTSLSEILGDKIKKLSTMREFMNLMYLAETPYEILGKALADYTFFQIDLISFGRHYKYIITQDPPPPDNIIEDPDKLDDWYDSSRVMKKIIDRDQGRESMGRATTIMGGTQEDLETLKGEGDIINLDTEIKKAAQNGPLNMEQMMKLHGIK